MAPCHARRGDRRVCTRHVLGERLRRVSRADIGDLSAAPPRARVKRKLRGHHASYLTRKGSARDCCVDLCDRPSRRRALAASRCLEELALGTAGEAQVLIPSRISLAAEARESGSVNRFSDRATLSGTTVNDG